MDQSPPGHRALIRPVIISRSIRDVRVEWRVKLRIVGIVVDHPRYADSFTREPRLLQIISSAGAPEQPSEELRRKRVGWIPSSGRTEREGPQVSRGRPFGMSKLPCILRQSWRDRPEESLSLSRSSRR